MNGGLNGGVYGPSRRARGRCQDSLGTTMAVAT
jgi:hypothetical protein